MNLPKFTAILPLNIARELAMTERRLTPEECLRWGFANRVARQEDLIETALELARGTVGMGPDAIKGLKRASLAIQEEAGVVELEVDWDARREARRASLAQSSPARDADSMEGMKAFAERRPAQYNKTI